MRIHPALVGMLVIVGFVLAMAFYIHFFTEPGPYDWRDDLKEERGYQP